MNYLRGALTGVLLICGMAIAILGTAAACEAFDKWNEEPVVAERITFNPGGSLTDFIEAFSRGRNNGTHYVIDGMCISACTMITGLVPKDHVCVTPYARLAFHSAWAITPLGPAFSKEGTRILWHVYPVKVRELLKIKYGWDGEGNSPHPELIYVEGDDLLTIFNPCKDND